MSVYARYKKSQDGLRDIVQLLETTPLSRRQKMIDIGMDEDPELTEKILKLVLTFEDVIALSDSQLAEALSELSPRVIAAAVSPLGESIKSRFLMCSNPKHRGAIREFWDGSLSRTEAGGAQVKLIEATRKLEKKGYIQIKKILNWDQI